MIAIIIAACVLLLISDAVIIYEMLIIKEWKNRFRIVSARKGRFEQDVTEDERIRDDYYIWRKAQGETEEDSFYIYYDPVGKQKFRSRRPRDKEWEKTAEKIPLGPM